MRGKKIDHRCKPGWNCKTCTLSDDCVGGATPPTKEESEMMRMAMGTKKYPADDETSTEIKRMDVPFMIARPAEKCHRKEPMVQVRRLPATELEKLLCKEYGQKLQPVVASLDERGMFRSKITKEMGMYVGGKANGY